MNIKYTEAIKTILGGKKMTLEDISAEMVKRGFPVTYEYAQKLLDDCATKERVKTGKRIVSLSFPTMKKHLIDEVIIYYRI